MSYTTLALLNRARCNRMAALTARRHMAPSQAHRAFDAVINVFADID